MNEVVLSSTECLIAKFVGNQRNRLSLRTKINMRRDIDQEDEEMNIQAVGAEMAVAKHLNVYPEFSPSEGKLPDFDMVWNGKKVDVKRNHLWDGDLLIPKLNPERFYILACGSLPKYHIIGGLLGAEVPKVGQWVELSKGPCWRVHPIHLRFIPREEPKF